MSALARYGQLTPSSRDGIRGDMFLPKTGTRYHSVITVQGVGVRPMPLTLLVFGDGTVSETVLAYCTYGRIRSLSFQTKKRTVHSLGLLYDYYKARCSPFFHDAEDVSRFLERFHDALTSGTIDKSSAGTRDTTELWWRGITDDKAGLIRSDIEGYVYYCVADLKMFRFENETEKVFIDTVCASADREAKFSRSPYSFFTHLASRTRKGMVSAPPGRRAGGTHYRTNVGKRPPVRFPFEKRMELLTLGTVSKGLDPQDPRTYLDNPLILRNQLVLGLLLFGGPRGSELCHMFIQDIVPNTAKNSLVASMVHPEQGLTYLEEQGEVARTDYMWERFRLRPLTQQTGHRRVGWKGIALDDAHARRAYLVLVASPAEHSYLRGICRLYIEVARPKLLRRPSPYLFVTDDGSPLKPRNIRDILSTACRRIGLCKYTAHSPRHMIGDLLRNRLDLGPSITMKILHHRSPTSQAVYTIQEPSAIQAVISQAYQNVLNGACSPDNISKGDLFIRIDPDQLFSDFLIGGPICRELL